MAENGRRKGDDALLLALATGLTVRDAARSAGVGERTATRRLANLSFRRRVAEARAEMVGRALGRMADGMAEAADTLRGLLRAATAAGGASLDDLAARLDALSERLERLERQLTPREAAREDEGEPPCS